jgi:hypothetical protein
MRIVNKRLGMYVSSVLSFTTGIEWADRIASCAPGGLNRSGPGIENGIELDKRFCFTKQLAV